MWRGAVKIFLDHPLRGAGTGGYQSEMRKIGDPKTPLITHPHNSILYMAASFGIIGLLALFWFFWEIIISAWKERETELGYFILSVAVVIFVSGMVNTQIIDVNAAFPLAVTAGLQQGLKRNAD